MKYCLIITTDDRENMKKLYKQVQQVFSMDHVTGIAFGELVSEQSRHKTAGETLIQKINEAISEYKNEVHI